MNFLKQSGVHFRVTRMGQNLLVVNSNRCNTRECSCSINYHQALDTLPLANENIFEKMTTDDVIIRETMYIQELQFTFEGNTNYSLNVPNKILSFSITNSNSF